MHQVAARTDPGKKRAHNEDAYASLPEDGLYIVADGVGGRSSGEVAAAIAVDSFRAAAPGLVERVREHDLAPSLETRNAVLVAMDDVLQHASRRIYETAEAESRAGMTTTVVIALFGTRAAFIAHVGDSRAYLIRDNQIRQLTEDHSMVNELVRSGKMTYEEARGSRHRHVITRAVGLYPSVQPSLGTVELQPGDRFLLCSDGLSDVVAPELMCTEALGDELEVGVTNLLQAALDKGGPDNITILLVDPAGGAPVDEATTRAGVLENLFLFEDMPYSARLQVGRIMQDHYFAPGEVLVQQGDPERSMYVILEGEVNVQRDGVLLARLGPGEHFGELALADNLPRSASVAGRTFGSAISLSADQLEEFCRREPALGAQLLWKLLRVMGQRLRQANERLAGPI